MDILKIVFLAVAGCMLAIQFKNQKSEYALYICFAVGIIIFTYSLDRLWIILEDLQLIELLSRENSGYLYILIKAIGITYICEFCVSILKDSGFSQMAMQIEMFGKLCILFLGIPVITALVDTIRELGR